MPTTSNHHPALNTFSSALQDYLLNHLPKDEDEADQAVIPWIVLFSLFEGWKKVNVTPIFRSLLQLSWPFWENQDRSHSDFGQLPQHLWAYSLGPMELHVSNLFKYLLTWSTSNKVVSTLLQALPLVSDAWDSWRQIFPVKTIVKSCVIKRCEKPCLGPPHLHSKAAFKLRHLSSVLTWAILQPCLCLAMHPTDPDCDPLTWLLCFTPDHHYRLACRPGLLAEPGYCHQIHHLPSAGIGGLCPYQWGYLSLRALLSPLTRSLPSL